MHSVQWSWMVAPPCRWVRFSALWSSWVGFHSGACPAMLGSALCAPWPTWVGLTLELVSTRHCISVNGYFDYVTKINRMLWWLMCMTTTIWTGMYKRGLGSTPHSDAWWEILFTPLLTPLGELMFLWAVSSGCSCVQKVMFFCMSGQIDEVYQ